MVDTKVINACIYMDYHGILTSIEVTKDDKNIKYHFQKIKHNNKESKKSWTESFDISELSPAMLKEEFIYGTKKMQIAKRKGFVLMPSPKDILRFHDKVISRTDVKWIIVKAGDVEVITDEVIDENLKLVRPSQYKQVRSDRIRDIKSDPESYCRIFAFEKKDVDPEHVGTVLEDVGDNLVLSGDTNLIKKLFGGEK